MFRLISRFSPARRARLRPNVGAGNTRQLPRLTMAAALLLTAALASCQSTTPDGSDPFAYDSNAPLSIGTADYAARADQHFHSGDFGLAEQLYRKAVEQQAGDVESWLGLAACYDQLARFDFADRAYDQAGKLLGKENIKVLNNHGYSYMLRGDYRSAWSYFERALKREPGNEIAINNMNILRQMGQRH